MFALNALSRVRNTPWRRPCNTFGSLLSTEKTLQVSMNFHCLSGCFVLLSETIGIRSKLPLRIWTILVSKNTLGDSVSSWMSTGTLTQTLSFEYFAWWDSGPSVRRTSLRIYPTCSQQRSTYHGLNLRSKIKFNRWVSVWSNCLQKLTIEISCVIRR